MPSRIEDYGLIGDTYTAALVAKDGSIDWLCLPRFDAPAAFAALLGSSENGRWLIGPADGGSSSSRSYAGETLVLETVFANPEGEFRVRDFMALTGEAEGGVLNRIVECTRGHAEVAMELTLRLDYGQTIPWVRSTGTGLHAVAGPIAIDLYSPVPLRNHDFRTHASLLLTQGETAAFQLVWRPSLSETFQPAPAEKLLEETLAWWEEWSGRGSQAGDLREVVQRSLITLKALTYGPTGGIVAAPTTSLPEFIGGTRNWDYRFCWVRDATFTLYALLTSGYLEEAAAWRDWLLRAVAGKPDQLQTLYGVSGERLLPEIELDWLPGHFGSRPVRIGNAAHRQFQLDIYGEIMDVFHICRRSGIKSDVDSWSFQRALMEVLERVWQNPDESLWEVRGDPRHFTHSRVMAWVAFDRAVKAIERTKLEGPLDRWKQLRQRVYDEVCQLGFNAERNSFVQYYGTQDLDASSLMIPLVGFLPGTDPRVTGTIAAIQEELMADGFVLRYRTQPHVDGLPPGEGAFIPSTFWLADALILAGRRDEGKKVFEHALAARNDLGLLSEEYDPTSGHQLGNFPQAFSHVALVNTAHNLSRPTGPAAQRAAAG